MTTNKNIEHTNDSIFEYNEYREYLNMKIKQAQESWGMVTKMAEAAQCQRSHLSRVLSGQLHLTLEQAYSLADFWGLNELETEYFLLLLQYQRSGTESLRKYFLKRIKVIQHQNENLKSRLNFSDIKNDFRSTYYSAWYWSAIHILTSIPQYQNSEVMARYLQLPVYLVESCLRILEEQKMVKREKDGRSFRWTMDSNDLHLDNSHPLIASHHMNWRFKAMEAVQKYSGSRPQDLALHYSVVQSLSKSDVQKVKSMLLKSIDQFQKIVRPSPEEDLVALNIDFFRLLSDQ